MQQFLDLYRKLFSLHSSQKYVLQGWHDLIVYVFWIGFLHILQFRATFCYLLDEGFIMADIRFNDFLFLCDGIKFSINFYLFITTLIGIFIIYIHPLLSICIKIRFNWKINSICARKLFEKNVLNLESSRNIARDDVILMNI